MISGTAVKLKREAIGKAQRECPICDSLHLEYEFVVDRSPVCGCQDCGLLFLNPQPAVTPVVEEQLPPSPGPLSELREVNASERIQQFVAYSGTCQGKLLLVGSDQHLPGEARKAGFEVLAYSAREFDALSRQDLPARIDGCILFCALEKMKDPLATLQLLHELLQASGALMVISPATDSRTAHLLRSSWWEFNRANLFYFSVDTLQNLLLKAGFGDPIVAPDRSLVSLNYLRQRISSNPQAFRRFRWLRGVMSLNPVLRNKAFRLNHGRTQFLVRARHDATEPRLSVIVPVFNEAATVLELIDRLLEKRIDGIDIEVIIIESNSTDGSRDLVLRYKDHPRVQILLQDAPKGKGFAVRSGLEAATGDVILFQDADLEYDVEDYDALIAPLFRFQNNFVLGSRHSAGKNSWKIREFADSRSLSAFFNLGHVLFLTLFNVLYSQRLTDPFTMFKVFRRECLYGLSFECNRFDFDYEIVIKLLRKGYKPLELPVNYRSRGLDEGKKVTMFRDPLTWIRALLKFRKSPLYQSPRRSN